MRVPERDQNMRRWRYHILPAERREKGNEHPRRISVKPVESIDCPCVVVNDSTAEVSTCCVGKEHELWRQLRRWKKTSETLERQHSKGSCKVHSPGLA